MDNITPKVYVNTNSQWIHDACVITFTYLKKQLPLLEIKTLANKPFEISKSKQSLLKWNLYRMQYLAFMSTLKSDFYLLNFYFRR